MIKEISKEGTLYYKGLAILLIVAHNFFHWLTVTPGENEMLFNFNHAAVYLSGIIKNPEYFIQTTFAFIGHYGITIFIFLSAYGLTKKHWKKKIKYFKFLKHRTLKIYIPFLISILLWAIYMYFTKCIGGEGVLFLDIIKSSYVHLVYKFVLISNFIPSELFSINGPWWFISLIMQFYILFPFLIKIKNKYLVYLGIAMMIFVICAQTYLNNLGIQLYLYGTIFGHFPEIILGIIFARKKNININNYFLFLIFILFLLGNINYIFWYFSNISILILFLVGFQKLKEKNFLKSFLKKMGEISMYVFLINGFLRRPLVNILNNYNIWWINILSFLFFFVIVSLVSLFLTKFVKIKFDKDKILPL